MYVRSLYPLVSSRYVARVLSTFLCSVVVAIRPFSKLGGADAFLILTLKELVFSPQEDLAQQLEATVLNIMGALIGIGISTLAKYLASVSTDNRINARLIPALFLVAVSFFAGWIKSRLPRLQLSTRISCFVSIWLLTQHIGETDRVLDDAGNFLCIILSAAVISFFSSIIVLRWSSTRFASDAALAFYDLRQCLSICLDTAFSGQSNMSSEHRELHKRLLKESVSLNATYSQAAFELRIGRVNVKSIKPLIGIVENIRRELSWGMAFPRSSFIESNLDEQTIRAIQLPALELGHAILSSMTAAREVIIETYQNPTLTRRSLRSEKESVSNAIKELLNARAMARIELRKISDGLDMEQRTSDGHVGFPPEFFNLCLFMISLLQMANEMHHALQISNDIIVAHESSPPRLWHPRFSWSWLGVAPSTFILDERTSLFKEEDSDLDPGLSASEARQGIAETFGVANITKKSVLVALPIAEKIPGVGERPSYTLSLRRIHLLIPLVWRFRSILRLRLALSKFIRSTQHSSHLRHALKNSIGVALLGFPAFLPINSSGSNWFIHNHGQWMIITFVWVLETNTGATWRVGYLRLIGTTLGAIYAYITWLICHTNPYGLVVMVTLADLPVSWMILHTTFGSLGVVANVTLPPIVFARYITPSDTTSIFHLTILRGLMIGAGIVAALAVNSLMFPRHCRVLFLNDTSRTLGLISQLYMALTRDIFDNPVLSFRPQDKRKNLKLEVQIRNSLHRLSVLITTMNDELSLVPKPTKRYGKVVSKLQKILDLMTGLRKVRENIPRKETVASVFKQRRELVSCICVSLFACEQVFKARQPIPQFLPSARKALRNLEKHVEERIRQAREEDGVAMGLSLVYAFAEVEVMKDIVNTLEELLDLTRQLFGTTAWLTTQQPWAETIISEEHPGNVNDGWYSVVHWEGSTTPH